jgi:hypothetical protein
MLGFHNIAVATVLAVVCVFPAISLAQEKPILAVMEIEDKTGKFRSKDMEAATEYLSTLLITSGMYSVVDKGRQETKKKQVVMSLKRESHDVCYDDKCRIALGRALAADTLLTCSIIGMGKSCTLSCKMVPLESEVADKAGVVALGCRADELSSAVGDVARQLSGATVATAQKGLSAKDLGKAVVGGWKLSATCQSTGGHHTCAPPDGWTILMKLQADGTFVETTILTGSGRRSPLSGKWSIATGDSIKVWYGGGVNKSATYQLRDEQLVVATGGTTSVSSLRFTRQ